MIDCDYKDWSRGLLSLHRILVQTITHLNIAEAHPPIPRSNLGHISPTPINDLFQNCESSRCLVPVIAQSRPRKPRVTLVKTIGTNPALRTEDVPLSMLLPTGVPQPMMPYNPRLIPPKITPSRLSIRSHNGFSIISKFLVGETTAAKLKKEMQLKSRVITTTPDKAGGSVPDPEPVLYRSYR